MLKPIQQRIPPGTPKKFLDRCVLLGLAKFDTHQKSVNFKDQIGAYVADPELRSDLVEMLGKPIGMLADKLRAMKTKAGKPVTFIFCYSPGGNHGPATDDDFRELWLRIARQYNIPVVDLSDDWYALQTTYFPTNDACCWNHFDAYGHQLLAYLMAREFINQHWVPIP
jgi:hypothetical protein